MSERVALITGGARGIGRGVALDLAKDGWTIAICYRTNQQDAEEVTQSVGEHGGKALALQSDVSKPSEATALVQEVEKTYDRIDALINGAGPYHRVPLLEETPEGWSEMLTNNLDPLFYLAKAVAPGMQARKYGRIISFGMANADKMEAQPHVTAHYIAKAGVLILTKTLAKLLAPHGITVNAISPGFIDSGSAPPEELAGMTKKIPAGYIGGVQDAVQAVRYFLSEDARYVTGANLHLSGGWGI